MANILRVAVVGVGEQSIKNIIPSIIQTPGAHLVTLCDIRRERAELAASIVGVPSTFENHRTMLEQSELDAVFVAAYPTAHEEIALDALAAGVSVFVEKPPAIDSIGLRRMAEKESLSGLTTGVGMNFRFADPVQEVVRAIKDGHFGKLSYLSISYFARAPSRRLWGLNTLAKEFLLAHAVHPIDLMLWIGGTPTRTDFSHVEQNGVLICEVRANFEGGAIGRVTVGAGAPKFMFDLRIITDKGVHITIDSLWEVKILGASVALPIFPEAGRWSATWTPTPLNSGHSRAGYSNAIGAFISSKLGGGHYRPRFRDMNETYRVLDGLESHLPKDFLALSFK
jgi:phthalate 4,5-cis-dihydrodiol dehydrogenase